MMERDLTDGRRIKLHQENIYYLRRVLENVKNGWRPGIAVPAGLEKANGYVEGKVATFSVAACVIQIVGQEIVYDFESRQRQKFTYREARGKDFKMPYILPGIAFTLGGGSGVNYAGYLWGFTGGDRIEDDYSGYFVGTALGLSQSVGKIPGTKIQVGGAIGLGQFTGAGNNDNPLASINGKGVVQGQVLYFGGGASTKSKSIKLPFDASFTATWYDVARVNGEKRPIDDYSIGRQELQMLRDVRSGDGSPVTAPSLMRKIGSTVGVNTFVKRGWIDPVDYATLQ